MKTLLWLDDVRNPLEGDWLVFSPIEQPFTVKWVKNYGAFCSYIKTNGLPDAICFDHDLGRDIAIAKRNKGMSKRQARRERVGTPTGKDAANFLVEYCMDNDLDVPPYNIQSANPVGKDNIDGLLKGYMKFRLK